MARSVDRDANQALWSRFAEVQGQYERMRGGLADLQQQLGRLRVTVTSTDELVTVTVDAKAQLISLELSPRTYQESDPRELAATITATVQRAGARATEQVTALMAGYLPQGSGATDFVRTGDFGDLLKRQDEATGYDRDVHHGR